MVLDQHYYYHVRWDVDDVHVDDDDGVTGVIGNEDDDDDGANVDECEYDDDGRCRCCPIDYWTR